MHGHQKHISIVLLFTSVAATVAVGQPDLPSSPGAKSCGWARAPELARLHIRLVASADLAGSQG